MESLESLLREPNARTGRLHLDGLEAGAAHTLRSPAFSSLSGAPLQPAGPWQGTCRKLPTRLGPAGVESWCLGRTGAAQKDAWVVAHDSGPQGSRTCSRRRLTGKLSPEQGDPKLLAV